jgi:hypothetical protein
VAGATVDDWEDLVSAPCPAGACLYIGDIGDNKRTRQHLTIYQVPVPASGSAATAPATASFLRYADHPHDAEALVVTRHGTFLKGGDAVRVDLVAVAEPQEEGVTFGRDGELLLLVSEGGGKKTAGMLTRLHCAFIR